MIRRLSFGAGVFLAAVSAVVLADPGSGGVGSCNGTCDDSNAQLTAVPGVTVCDGAQTGYTCDEPAGAPFQCTDCIHNEANPAKCRCKIE
jgi:hypothetical protein